MSADKWAKKKAGGRVTDQHVGWRADDGTKENKAPSLDADTRSSVARQRSAQATKLSAGSSDDPQKAEEAHATAGVAHLEAAKAHRDAGNTKEADAHEAEASEHASVAGPEWDEGSHPRGPDGKFI